MFNNNNNNNNDIYISLGVYIFGGWLLTRRLHPKVRAQEVAQSEESRNGLQAGDAPNRNRRSHGEFSSIPR
jgi:hypothetical protein